MKTKNGFRLSTRFAIVALSLSAFLVLGLAVTYAAQPPGGGSGAIFTTTPDGGIVNENVHYEGRHFVYLDGGPKQNAPAHAAGLDEGYYVFQITDPPGKLLLSRDPARCRIVHVNAEGVIDALVPPTDAGVAGYTGATSDNWADDGDNQQKQYKDEPCHVPGPLPDSNPGTYAPTPDITGVGRHDTNPDVDHNDVGAIVVQMMPYGLTPNPGGVYKAWMTPIEAYVTVKGANLNDVPDPIKGKVRPHDCFDFCAKADPGFEPSHRYTKTDNFKVTEQFPAEITVRKFEDLNGNGIWDPDEPEIGLDKCVDEATGDFITCPGGWPYDFTEPLDGGTKTQKFFTPKTHVAGIPGIYTAEEYFLLGWVQTASRQDGTYLIPVQKAVSVEVLTTAPGESHEIVFGNFKKVDVTACKYEDFDGDGDKDAPIPGWTVHLTIDGAIQDTQQTGADGCYTWTDLGPLNAGSFYDVSETVPGGWTPTSPTEFDFESPPQSGASYQGDFTNFENVQVKACKYEDYDGDGDKDAPIPGWTVHLTIDGAIQDTQQTGADGCYTWTDLGPLNAGSFYDVSETVPDGWIALTPTFKAFESPPQSGASYSFTFINTPTQGCTPGFWQGGPDKPDPQSGGARLWDELGWFTTGQSDPDWDNSGGQPPSPFNHHDSFDAFFGDPAGVVADDLTMFALIDTGGGSEDWRKLARDVVAAYLNASWGMAFAYTPGEVADIWTTASNDGTFLDWHTKLDAANNAIGGCPISAGQ
jgi:hypothetical protein